MPGVNWINRTLNPVVDAYHVVTGKDFATNQPISRSQSAVSLGLTFIPGGKIESAAIKTAESSIVKSEIKKISLDNNALIAAIEGGKKESVVKAIGNNQPIVSMTVAKEYLTKGSKVELKAFMREVGATVSKKGASTSQVKALQKKAEALGRKVGTNDASIIGGAINNNASILTNDKRMNNFIKTLGIPVFSY